jgi:hypothetical protein
MKNYFSMMAGSVAGLGTVGAVTLANATSSSEALTAYMTFVMPAMFLGMGTAIASIDQWKHRKKNGGFIEPKRLAASFAVVAGVATGIACLDNLPLTPHAQNETHMKLTGQCYDARIRDGEVILPPACSLKP